jgi:hypothetical protein
MELIVWRVTPANAASWACDNARSARAIRIRFRNRSAAK